MPESTTTRENILAYKILLAEREAQGKSEIMVITPKPWQFLQMHPIYCGLLATFLLMNVQWAGIEILNKSGYMRCLCHLYNAAKQENLLSHRWMDLDLLIGFYKDSPFFCGEPPTDISSYSQRWWLDLGFSLKTYPEGRNRSRSVRKSDFLSKKGPRVLSNNVSPLCCIFMAAIVQRAQSLPSSRDLLTDLVKELKQLPSKVPFDECQSVLESVLSESPELTAGLDHNMTAAAEIRQKMCLSRPEHPHEPGHSRQAVRVTSDAPVDLLHRVFLAVSSEMVAVKFEWFAMHRRCSTILRDLKPTLDTEFAAGGFAVIDPEHVSAIEALEEWVPPSIQHIASRLFSFCLVQQHLHQKRGKKGKQERHCAALTKMAEVLNKHLQSGMGAIETLRALQERRATGWPGTIRPQTVEAEQDSGATLVDTPESALLEPLAD